jgi:protein-S-isoprenylcysteine O-methyltransferase Ste14
MSKIKRVRKPAPSGDYPKVITPPPIIVLIMIAAGFAASLIQPLRFIDGYARYVAGGALLLVSAVIILSAYFKMKGAGTNVDVRKPATTVLTDGVYSYSRNPMYVSLVIFLAAVSMLLNNLWIMILIPVFIFIMGRGVIAREELYLEEKFGAQYTDYKERVRRWL